MAVNRNTTYQSVRVWHATHEGLASLGRYYNKPMVRVLDDLVIDALLFADKDKKTTDTPRAHALLRKRPNMRYAPEKDAELKKRTSKEGVHGNLVCEKLHIRQPGRDAEVLCCKNAEDYETMMPGQAYDEVFRHQSAEDHDATAPRPNYPGEKRSET